MREKLIGALIGLIIGIILASIFYSFYVSTYPQATDTDKGVILFVCVIVVVGLGFVGFQKGEDP